MICRLCVLEFTTEFLDIFSSEGIQLQIADIISKHFWFKPLKDDPVSDKICFSCWSKVDNFHQFYCLVEESQQNLGNIIESKNIFLIEEQFLLVDKLKEEKNDTIEDYHITEDSTTLINNEDSLINSSISIKTENDSDTSRTEKSEDLTIQNKITRRKRSSKKSDDFIKLEQTDLDNFKKHSKIISTKNSKRTHTKNHKSSPADIDVNFDDNILELDDNHSENDSNNPKCTKRGPYKKSSKQLQKENNKHKRINKNMSETEKLEFQKKMEEEDKLIAKFTTMICSICDNDLGTFNKLKQHFKLEHKTRYGHVICCNKKIFSKSELLVHIKLHTNPDMFSCNLCNKNFSTRYTLKFHMDQHHESDESKLLKCEKCQKKFSKQSLLDKHQLIHISSEERRFQCDTCNKSYPSKYHLTVHKTHVHEKQYHHVCDICAKKVPGKKLLEQHRLEHEGIVEPKAQCQKCGSWFKNEKLLKKHLKRHEEALLGLKCKLCDKSAPTKGALSDHIKYVHKMEKKFKCSFCDKAFKEQVVLKEHMTTHTGGALYVCTFCPKTFNFNANMYAHRKRYHPKEYEELQRQRMMTDSS